jgi:hypothetical protein
LRNNKKMPKIAIFNAFTFYIYIYDVLNEPAHLHITKNKKGYNNSAKIWIESLKFAESGDFSEKELNLLQKLVESNQQKLLNAFEKVKRGEKIKTIQLK